MIEVCGTLHCDEWRCPEAIDGVEIEISAEIKDGGRVVVEFVPKTLPEGWRNVPYVGVCCPLCIAKRTRR